jgi:polypyrimidine tract-binding protein 1
MKDYIALNLDCFKKPGSKNYSNINPPSSTLHLSNIALSVEENGLKQAFLMDNLNVQPFKFFPNGCKMVLVQLALVEPDNYQLSQTSHLRVSFLTLTI